jgi:hypothetical protein
VHGSRIALELDSTDGRHLKTLFHSKRGRIIMRRTVASVLSVSALLLISTGSSSAAGSYVVREILPASRNQPPTALTRSAWGNAVTLAPSVLAWVADKGLALRVDQEVARLRGEIDAAMPRDGGVLIVVGIQESSIPDDNGFRHPTLLEAYVATSGRSAQEAVQRFLNSDRLDRGPAKGFVRRDTFLWITR